MLIRTACLWTMETGTVYLLWPLEKGMHLKVKMEWLYSDIQGKLGGHGGHDFRHSCLAENLNFLKYVRLRNITNHSPKQCPLAAATL